MKALDPSGGDGAFLFGFGPRFSTGISSIRVIRELAHAEADNSVI
jgi:hypothetical protein